MDIGSYSAKIGTMAVMNSNFFMGQLPRLNNLIICTSTSILAREPTGCNAGKLTKQDTPPFRSRCGVIQTPPEVVYSFLASFMGGQSLDSVLTELLNTARPREVASKIGTAQSVAINCLGARSERCQEIVRSFLSPGGRGSR